MVSLAGTASAIGSAGRHERAWESPRSEQRRRRSSSGGRSRSGKKHGEVGLLPLPALPIQLVLPPPLRLRLRMQAKRLMRCLLSPLGVLGVDGGCSGGDRSASGRDRSPRPGPSGLGSGSRSSLGAGLSRSGYGGRFSPSPSGAAEDDRSSNFDSIDMDRDDSFKSVLHFIQEFHSLEVLPCTGLRATIRVFPGSSLASFPLAAVSPGGH